MKWPESTRYLKRLGVQKALAERNRTEIVLAVCRAVLALLSTVAVYVDPTEPVEYTKIARTLMFVWLGYSLAALFLVRLIGIRRYTPLILHGTDVLFPAIMALFTQGPNSPFFVYIIFALAAAAFRWGLLETFGTALVGMALLDLEAFLLTSPPAWELTLLGAFDLNGVIIRCSYIMILGVLIGYFGETEKERRSESTVLNRLLRSVRQEESLGINLHKTVAEFMRIYQSKWGYVLIADLIRQRYFLYQLAPNSLPDAPLMATELAPTKTESLVRQLPPTFFTECDADLWPRYVLDTGELRTEELTGPTTLPFHIGELKSVLSTSFQLGEEWFARVFLVNGILGGNKEQELRFAERLITQLAPVIYSVFLVRRLRKRAGAIERARVARELHDGAIQSLISAEMQVDVLRRRAERDSEPMGGELTRIQELLRAEVLNLRELMQQMKPVDLSPEQLLDYMADAVDRFRRDTGIYAQFTTEVQDVALSPHTCRELVRIMQEALVNVRKHARAQRVLVRFGRSNQHWFLTVEDDGRGLDFDGRLTNEQLMNSPRGPAIIKERVRNIGAELNLESHPSAGLRLEVTIPLKGHAIHGSP